MRAHELLDAQRVDRGRQGTGLQNTKRTDDYARELIFLYDEAAFNIEKEIEALFARFAKDNGLTEEAARQLLEGKEFSVWRKSIEEYIAEASDAGQG